jgi:hypothetical protein
MGGFAMVSIPQQHACFKVQSCELRELGDETQKMRIEMNSRKYQINTRRVNADKKSSDSLLVNWQACSTTDRGFY